MKQIESSVAMVTKPMQWEEFAAYDKLFSYFVRQGELAQSVR